MQQVMKVTFVVCVFFHCFHASVFMFTHELCPYSRFIYAENLMPCFSAAWNSDPLRCCGLLRTDPGFRPARMSLSTKAITATTWEEVTKVEKAADQHQQRLEVRRAKRKRTSNQALCSV